MKIIDTHCHLQSEEFKDNLKNILNRMDIVEKAFLATSYKEDIENAAKLVQLYDNLYYFAGIHPHNASKYDMDTLQGIQEHLKNTRCLGVGEIGLDYFYEYSPKNIQKEVFSSLLDLAIENKKWVSIHIREATGDAIDILRSKKDLKAIIHCFNGDLDLLKISLDNNFLLGIGGMVTFKNSIIRENIKQLPLKNIVLETDAPYLAPVPKRGKINEPSFLIYTLDALSKLLNLENEKLAQIIYNNSLKILHE